MMRENKIAVSPSLADWSDNIKYTSDFPTGRYPVEKIFKKADSRDKRLWEASTMEMPEVKFVKIYAVKQKIPQCIGHRCAECDKTFVDPDVIQNHKNVCTRINTIKKLKFEREQAMPIQSIIKNGKTYYRWGDTGAVYSSRAQAEEQARAIMASSYYKKPKNKESE
jgi:hypothetical protein